MPFSFITDEALREQVIAAHKGVLATEVERATSALTAKVDELKGEKKALQATVKKMEGIDPDQAREAIDFLQNNKDAQLIRDGKTDEVVAKRTSALREDYEARLTDANKRLQEQEGISTNLLQRLNTKTVEDQIGAAALKTGVRPEALHDILSRAKAVFTVADDGISVEARDAKGSLVKTADDLVLTPSLWLKDLAKDAPHFWPDSEGLGAGGGGGPSGDIMAQMKAAAAKGDMPTYRRLQAKRKQGAK